MFTVYLAHVVAWVCIMLLAVKFREWISWYVRRGICTSERGLRGADTTILLMLPMLQDNMIGIATLLILKSLMVGIGMPRLAYTCGMLAWAVAIMFIVEGVIRMTRGSRKHQRWEKWIMQATKLAYIILSAVFFWNIAHM